MCQKASVTQHIATHATSITTTAHSTVITTISTNTATANNATDTTTSANTPTTATATTNTTVASTTTSYTTIATLSGNRSESETSSCGGTSRFSRIVLFMTAFAEHFLRRFFSIIIIKIIIIYNLRWSLWNECGILGKFC